jgi:hypothetical protein
MEQILRMAVLDVTWDSRLKISHPLVHLVLIRKKEARTAQGPIHVIILDHPIDVAAELVAVHGVILSRRLSAGHSFD